jgi:molybdopterin synthase sulfur carrier subunit
MMVILMAVVWIPALLRDLTGGQETVSVQGSTVRQIIEALDRLYPGMKDRLLVGDFLRSGIAVAVDTQLSRRGLLESVSENSEVHFLPAIAGGCSTSSAMYVRRRIV